MTDYLRFLFSSEDRDRIDPASIRVEVTPFDPPPAKAAERWPESLRIQFNVLDPGNGAPQLRMIFPGEIRYVPNAPTGSQVLPTPDNIKFIGNNVEELSFWTFPNRGTIQIVANARRVALDLKKNCSLTGIGISPTAAWFAPVELSQNFLNDTVLNGLERRVIPLPVNSSENKIDGTDPGWPKHAVTHFYSSDYKPLLKLHDPPNGVPVDRNLDDVVRLPMPHVVMDPASGLVDLTITMATPRTIEETKEFPGSNPLSVDSYHPGHQSLEIVPTRVFLQQERSKLIAAEAGNPVADAVIGNNTFLSNVKSALTSYGFGDLGASGNTFQRRVRWAVREFQIYSKMPRVATEPEGAVGEYANRLQQIANRLVYEGPINGTLNAMTRARIEFWGRHRLRCPVVVTARTGPGYTGVVAGGENLWAHDDLKDRAPRMFVRDVSDHYALPPLDARDIQIGSNRYIVLGFYHVAKIGGPNMEPHRHSWSSMDLDSTKLTGLTESAMATQPENAAIWSNYLTLAPTIKEETGLRFDVVNAWDNATISVPLFHYSLEDADRAELAGFLTAIQGLAPATFDTAVRFFGVKTDRNWPNTHNFQAKRTARIQLVRGPGNKYKSLPKEQVAKNYFKTWHWYYRFVMANRIFDDWKRTAYDFALTRLSDIRGARMIGQPAGNAATSPKDADGNTVTIGQVFTSERALGLLLRWHVWRPNHIVLSNQSASARLWAALARAQDTALNGGISVDWSEDVANWTDEHERALIAGVTAEGATTHNNLAKAFAAVQKFTLQGHALSQGRNSYIVAVA